MEDIRRRVYLAFTLMGIGISLIIVAILISLGAF